MIKVPITCFLLLLLFVEVVHANVEDSMLNFQAGKKNQLFLEFLGNNFIDPNSSADAGPISINYCRKLVLKRSSFMFAVGAGPLRANGYDPVNMTATAITIWNFPAGIFWRYKYKRNGLWVGTFFTTAIGRIVYTNTPAFNYIKKSSFQLSPNLSYQFQSNREGFVCRIAYTPKILASSFSQTSGDDKLIYPLWFGLSIGGAW